jgi:hypothetical protein
MADKLPAERWVNARITVLVALGVPVEADTFTKQEAVSDAIESLALPRGAVASGTWEDCEVPEQEIPTIPDPPTVVQGEQHKAPASERKDPA